MKAKKRNKTKSYNFLPLSNSPISFNVNKQITCRLYRVVFIVQMPERLTFIKSHCPHLTIQRSHAMSPVNDTKNDNNLNKNTSVIDPNIIYYTMRIIRMIFT